MNAHQDTFRDADLDAFTFKPALWAAMLEYAWLILKTSANRIIAIAPQLCDLLYGIVLLERGQAALR